MKKVFMSVAIVAMMVAASACGSNNSKKVEAEVEIVEEVVDSTCCGADSTCCAKEVVEEVKAE